MKPNYMLQEFLNVGNDIAMWNKRSKFPRLIKKRMIKKMLIKDKNSISKFITTSTLDDVANAFVVAVFNNSKLDIVSNDDHSRRYIFEDDLDKWYAIDVVNALDVDNKSTLTKITIVISTEEYTINTLIITMKNYEIEDATIFNTEVSDDYDEYDEMLMENNADSDKYKKTYVLFRETVFKFCMDVLKNKMEED